MQNSLKKQFLLLISLAFSLNIRTEMYQQLIPKLLEKINIEQPSESEQTLINACRAFDQFGTNYPTIQFEIWQAINSIDMFPSLMPQYARTNTLAGLISWAKRCAQMTDNISALQKRQDVVRYLEHNQQTTNQFEKILKHCAAAEHKFLQMFKQVDEEEQGLLDVTHKQLYFSRLGLDRLNESPWALEIGPRLNQLHTLGWCTIPPLLASAIHKNTVHYATELSLNAQKWDIARKVSLKQKSQAYLERKIRGYEEDIKYGHLFYKHDLQNAQKEFEEYKTLQNINDEEITKPLAQLDKDLVELQKNKPASTETIFTNLKEELRKKDSKTLTEEEKLILNANYNGRLFYDNPKVWAANLLPTLLKQTAQESVLNLPTMAIDVAKMAKKEITEQFIYNTSKKSLIEFGEWDPNSYKTTAAALGYTAWTYTLASIYPFILYKRYYSTKNLLTLIHEKQADLLVAGHLIKSMEMLCKIIAKDETLKDLMQDECKKLCELFSPTSKKTSADLKLLVDRLLSSSFQGDDSYLLSQQGKILATHHLLQRIKGELIPYFEALGDIDAHLAIFKLYQEFKNHPRVTFCLPEFVDSNTPVLEAQNFWHPLINPRFVIANDLIMGHGSSANLIITGPNAGGKTTSLMSLVINIIFAQSFGIAPSSSLSFTPFAKIHSYLDITTNLQAGLSLFAAEVDRSKKLKQSILSCTPGQKTFTIIDELFSGTAPDVASEVGFKFASQLGEMLHSMTIITTHFPRLTALEQETPHFENYKVADALIAANGKVTYPFKLVKGASTQNIAQHMLEQEGII